MKCMRFSCSNEEYNKLIQQQKSQKSQKSLPKYQDLIINSFKDLNKEILTFDDLSNYIHNARQSESDQEQTIKAINKALRNNIINKITNPSEKRKIIGHQFSLYIPV